MNEQPPLFAKIFYPQSIAVVGVSPEEGNLARNIVLNSLTFGFKGEIFSVGLTEGVAFGQRIYPSLESIHREIDLAVILTPARTIPGILEQCGRRGIHAVVIESGGFSELGEEGRPLERACVEVADRYGIRFVGPNGIGVTNMEQGLALPFMPLRRDLTLGPVSILAQSGGVGLSYLGFLTDERIGINKFVSMGNKLNIDENDLLEYLIQDPGTKIILMYLEGFTNGRSFVEIASRSEKPILVHKSNRFESSAQIAHSHTTALFADDKLVDYALDQAGCVRVNTMDDAMHYIKSLTLPSLKGNRLAVVCRSGGHAVIAADACGYYGFQLPRFPEEMLRRIETHVRARVIRLQNPLDLGDLFELEFYTHIVEELLKMEDVDGVLLGHGYRKGYEEEASRSLFKKVEDLVEKYRKPVATVVMTEASEKEYLRKNVRIPIFDSPENAMRAFHLSHRWISRRPVSLGMEVIEGVEEERAGSILEKANARDHLFLGEAMQLISCYGFCLPPYALARTEEEAVQVWQGMGAPVAMKINLPHISHKTDKGALRLDLTSEGEIRSAFQELRGVAGGDLEVLIQQMAPPGREIILGGRQDASFGPVVLFGLGGVLVEVFEDAVWRLAPLGHEEAAHMVHGIRAARLLSGVRGEGPYDLEALLDLLVRLSHLLVTFPRIREIDINPVMVFPQGQGAQAVDARVVLG
ncbi:MAG: acetate--CoA ligase family protein [Deltaproteobacteria bacterium]|nr:acetate--CoA ligase family protein [Deltaproteobacteria bacterium]